MQDHTRVGSTMRTALRGAADDKILRIVSMLDEVVDGDTNRTILDPLRDRLAVLRPSRPLRINRLLFMPLDAVIVPARYWRPDRASVPRTVLTALFDAIRHAPQFGLPDIERAIAGCSTGDAARIGCAGELLWPRAAGILAAAPLPSHWAQTGLPPALYRPLADAVAAVLVRAPQLHRLHRDCVVGVLEPDEAVVGAVLKDLERELPDACAMIVRLILAAAPAASATLRRLIARQDAPADRLRLQRASRAAGGHMLDDLEHGSAFARTIGSGSAADVARQVDHAVALLDMLQDEAGRNGTPDAGPRLRAIRGRLDQACRARFAGEVEHALVGPIGSATAPVPSAEQDRFEACSRNLRAIETVARRIGGAAEYDAQLLQAAAAVSAAAASGVLTAMRQIRLIEILQGSEAAHALYRAASGSARHPDP